MILKFAIDDLEREIDWEKILLLAFAIVALALFQGIFRFLMRRILVGTSRKAEYLLRNDFAAHLQKLSPSYYDRNTTGDIMARATSDMNAVRMAFGPGIVHFADTILVTVFALTMMITINWKLTLAAFAIFPVVSLIVYIIGKKTYALHTRVQESYSEMNAFAQENISGVRVVKSFALENQHIGSFRKLSDDYLNRNMDLVKMQALFIPILYFLLGVGIMIVLLMGGIGIIKGEMSLGDFAAFVAYLMMLSWPMIALGWVVNIFQRAEASMARIDKIMTIESGIADSPRALPFIADAHRIEFRRLNFAYGERGEVLHDISLTIEPGSSLGIVGSLGSGKSTLVKLIARLYEPPPNTLFIGGTPVEDVELKSLRVNIAFVPQDAFLFSETVADNIVFDEGIESDRLFDVSRTAELLGDVEGFAEGFKTVVGERGITLSGGQKQRVTLARALLKDAPILIIDDALTAVDASTEANILSNLKEAFKGKTALVVSHRISAVSGLDSIIVMDEGRIVERGTHRELLEMEGMYCRMYRRQLLEEELEMI